MRKYLKQLRDNKGMSQHSVADSLGCYQSYYSAIENGNRQRDMSYSMMEKLAAVFDVPIQTIIDAEAKYKIGG